MITEQFVLSPDDKEIEEFYFIPDLILIFVSPFFVNIEILKKYREIYPNSIITGCTTAGEIEDISVHLDSAVITAVKFDKSKIVYNEVQISSPREGAKAGEELVRKFDQEGLRHIYVLSEGIAINGTDLVSGLANNLSNKFSITGGLAGDGYRSLKTFVLTNDFSFVQNTLVAIGFYGEDLKIGFGALEGLNSLGVDRIITKSEKNVVFEIDGEPALDLINRLVGAITMNKAESIVLLPLSVREKVTDSPKIRSIKSFDTVDNSITFTGDMPEGSYVRLMKSNIERLINAAEGAAEVSIEPIGNTHTDFVIVTSCVARRKVLKELVEEEIVAVRDVVGEDATITGFYSYGEISPFVYGNVCELMNQSIVVTSFSESDIE
jgi:hypothetical protein